MGSYHRRVVLLERLAHLLNCHAMDEKTLMIAGPTASGKSALALAIAEAFGGVIINADSMQVYRDLRILSARPTPAEEAAQPHRLYGYLPATEIGSAGRWRADAVAEIEQAWAADQLPIVVGGTGLYFRALVDGLAPVPAVPDDMRQAAEAELNRLGPAEFHRRLARIDPESAARLAVGDRQRLVRAYAVHQATGRSLADWQAETVPGLSGRHMTVLLDPPREWLYQRCEQRFDLMMAGGALAEVKALAARDLPQTLPVMKALGVPHLLAHLGGELAIEEAVDKAKTLTRRYAKRQMTWFRHQMAHAARLTAQDLERNAEEIFPKICDFMLTPAS
jgi:tRNA dimethylallyltransferase